MENRTLVWTAIVSVVIASAVGLYACSPDGAPVPGVQGDAVSMTTGNDNPETSDGSAGAEDALAIRRGVDIQKAVTTTHAYLRALGSGDHKKADTFWVNGERPGHIREADLRTVDHLLALRIDNETPIALDSTAVPDALEVPVKLRLSVNGAPTRYYRGNYRLRRAVSDYGWEITSATINVDRDAK